LLAGEDFREHYTVEPTTATGNGLFRQQIDAPLFANLRSGDYEIILNDARKLGNIEIVNDRPDMIVGDDIETSHPLDARFGNDIRLLGYDIDSESMAPGETIALDLYWSALQAMSSRYKISVFVQGDSFNPKTNNPLWGQIDAEPVNWEFPTTLWIPSETIKDPYRIVFDGDAPAGNYRLGVAVYGLIDGERLPVYDVFGEAIGDTLTLFEFEID
jgi:hypothetical protein